MVVVRYTVQCVCTVGSWFIMVQRGDNVRMTELCIRIVTTRYACLLVSVESGERGGGRGASFSQNGRSFRLVFINLLLNTDHACPTCPTWHHVPNLEREISSPSPSLSQVPPSSRSHHSTWVSWRTLVQGSESRLIRPVTPAFP